MSTTEAAKPSGIVIYSSPFCGYCAAAKSLLQKKGARYDEIDVLADPSRRREMIELTGRRTVPQIFIGTRHVGGFDDLSELENAGQLDPLLSELETENQ
jgi:glutaredoxin 3